MAAINLMKEYVTKLDNRFSQKSLTEAHCGHDYEWDGVNSIIVYTMDNMAVQDYTLTGANRFTGGVFPTNIGDEANTYTLQMNRSFGGIIEGVQNMDQKSIKKPNSLLKQTWDEVMVPEIDKYRLTTWANGAGKTVINSTALTNQTIVKQILLGQAHLNNKLVGREGRVCFITETMAVETQLAAELAYNEAYTSKAIVNGQIAKMGGLPIVAIPDDWMPAGVEFMIKYKRSSADPTKLKMLRALTQVQGVYGTVLEGLTRYDSFVMANKADGIYVYGQSGITPDVTTTVSGGVATLAGASGNSAIYYTLDGSNPKADRYDAANTSGARAQYNGSSKPSGLTAGTVIKAYAETKPGGVRTKLDSGIVTHVVTAAEA